MRPCDIAALTNSQNIVMRFPAKLKIDDVKYSLRFSAERNRMYYPADCY
jgi:hypothetical protein